MKTKKIPIGIQLYSLREAIPGDMRALMCNTGQSAVIRGKP
jgi:hypothetical protein